jgi:hypothetical protein
LPKRSWEEVGDIGWQFAKVLAYLQAPPFPLRHSDLHSGNVLCQSDGQIRLLDSQ